MLPPVCGCCGPSLIFGGTSADVLGYHIAAVVLSCETLNLPTWTGMFGYMPMMVLTSKFVPEGLEATTYALLAGEDDCFGCFAARPPIVLFLVQVTAALHLT
jgi:hypothetical protein